MNILILQGPNLNLLGLKASKAHSQLTHDKLNRAIRKHVKSEDVALKFLQTHKQFQAINFLQRNRNWAQGLLVIPTSWAYADYTIAETIQLVNLKTAAIYFESPFQLGPTETDSIIKGSCITSYSGEPIETCIRGLDYLTQ